MGLLREDDEMDMDMIGHGYGYRGRLIHHQSDDVK